MKGTLSPAGFGTASVFKVPGHPLPDMAANAEKLKFPLAGNCEAGNSAILM